MEKFCVSGYSMSGVTWSELTVTTWRELEPREPESQCQNCRIHQRIHPRAHLFSISSIQYQYPISNINIQYPISSARTVEYINVFIRLPICYQYPISNILYQYPISILISNIQYQHPISNTQFQICRINQCIHPRAHMFSTSIEGIIMDGPQS